MNILIQSILESLRYLLNSINQDVSTGKNWSPELPLDELFCQLFDDTGLGDSIEQGTTSTELGAEAKIALVSLYNAFRSLCEYQPPYRGSDVDDFRILIERAIHAIE